MNTRVKWVGWGAGWSIVGAAWLAACGGGGFQNDDCVETHTCAAKGGDASAQGGAGPDGAGAPTAGASASGATAGTDATAGTQAIAGSSAGGASAGAGGNADNGGAGPARCVTDDDCSDGDPKNGVELCQPDGSCLAGNPPPFVLSVVPTADSSDIATDSDISIIFNEPIDVATANANNIQLKLGNTVVDGTIDASGSKVTLTPKSPLFLLGEYSLSVTGVKDLDGAPMLAPYEEKFTTADGEWTSRTIASGGVYQLSDTIPMTATGDALIAWTANPDGSDCPPTAAWYRRGTEVGADKVMDLPGASDCYSIVAGGNADGTAGMAWQVPDGQHGTYVEQFRSGKWAAGDGKVSADTASSFFRIGASPTGALSFFYSSGTSTSVLRSSAAGKWLATADSLTMTAAALAAPQVAYDTAGNAIAVWRARDAMMRQEILVSYYTTQSGKWSPAALLPGSVQNNADATYEVGVPAIAMDEQGGAVALWVARGGGSEGIVASRYTVADGWSKPGAISPASLFPGSAAERPALIFDGNTFVGAFVAQDNNDKEKDYTYTVSFDRGQGSWLPAERRQTASDLQAVEEMPRLVSDGRGHQILLWATVAPDPRLMAQRQVDGVWSKSTHVGSFVDSNHGWSVGSSKSGAAAVAWRVYNQGAPIGIELASFY